MLEQSKRLSQHNRTLASPQASATAIILTPWQEFGFPSGGLHETSKCFQKVPRYTSPFLELT